MTKYYSHGKLLLTGEYVVLDGALALGLPTRKGQSLRFENNETQNLLWKSIDSDGHLWFKDSFNIKKLSSENQGDISKQLAVILQAAKRLNPDFLTEKFGYNITTTLEFPRDWGLGSSSTLINNIANWANVNAYELLDLTFGGSGYDIACAANSKAITYQLNEGQRLVTKTNFRPKFSEHLYFVHLNKKQNSRESISNYQIKKGRVEQAVSKISAITRLILHCDALITFEGLLNKHETIISQLLEQPTIKEQLFNDYKGSIKSLGAWGGDFVLVTSRKDPSNYFKNKGYNTIVNYDDMILN